ncbi:PKD domain-containing protein [Marinigracilibium pacificum]|uniref:PKD domain-containing protein n=1 Tax=Marinigracilibium pacificum TaxID=2729599 RepID=A0A848J3C6_9BACT|nr:PKD domain-containing protein [Marinigracilibium pacificum]NMM48849.1 PKD domain-containing protein [Marinigracilibium pacificum]
MAVFTFIVMPAIGQDLSNNIWYFGNSSEFISFTGGEFQLNTGQRPLGTGGSAVLTDPQTGKVLFYTDGNIIVDADGNTMAGVGMPNGDNSNTQPVVIVPDLSAPETYKVYYIEGGQVKYSVVDMSQPGNGTTAEPLGEIISTGNIPGPSLSNRSGALLLVSDGNGGYYLLSQEANTNTISVSVISSTGDITASQDIPFASLGNFTVKNFSIDLANGKLAVNTGSSLPNPFIADIDLSSNSIIFDQYILNLNSKGGEATSMAWSPSGRFLYISFDHNTGPDNIYRYDLQNPSVLMTGLLGGLSQTVNQTLGIGLGPDNNIYFLGRTGSGAVDAYRFNNPDSTNFFFDVERLTSLSGNGFDGSGFPQFGGFNLADPNLNFGYTRACSELETFLYPEFERSPDSIIWTSNGQVISRDMVPRVIFDSPGTANVTMTAYYAGEPRQTTLPVVIQDSQGLTAQLQDTTICPGTITLDPMASGGSGNFSYYWSTDEISPTIDVDSSGVYWVTVQDEITGCATSARGQVTVVGDSLNEQDSYWYFGQGAGIYFDFENGPQASPGGLTNNLLGGDTYVDNLGRVWFYTDGVNVYSAFGMDNSITHTDMPGGQSIEDGMASQSTIIVDAAGDESMKYIFTTEPYGSGTDGVYRLGMTLVDLTEIQGTLIGEAVATEQSSYLFNDVTEALAVSSDDRWLIAHELETNSFLVWEITAEGIGSPVKSQVGSVHGTGGTGEMELFTGALVDSTQVNWLATTVPGENAIEIFQFNDSTGVLSDPVRIDLPSTPFGLEFHSGGRKLAISTGNGTIYEIDLTSFDASEIQATLTALNTTGAAPGGSVGALQTAPNGTIYLAIEGQSELFPIIAADTGTVSTINYDQGIDTGGTVGKLLPRNRQGGVSLGQSPSIATGPACFGSPTLFTGNYRYDIDTYTWNFGDGNTSTQQNPQHQYAAPGEYIVTLRLTRCNGSIIPDDILTDTVTVYQLPTDPLLQPSQVLCDEPPLVLDATNGDTDIVFATWSTRGVVIDSTTVLNVPDIGLYEYSLINAGGCETTGEVLVIEPLPLDLGPDAILCEGEALTFDTQIAGANLHNWYLDGADLGNTTSSQDVDTSIPGLFEYVVEVRDPASDPATPCLVRDTVMLQVNAIPVFTLTGNSIVCGATNGQIDIDITSTGFYAYDVTNTGDNTVVDNQTGLTGPINIPVTGTIPADIYLVSILDEQTGCAAQDNVTINSSAFTPTAAINVECVDGTNSIIIGNLTGGSSYNFIIENTDINQTEPTRTLPADVNGEVVLDGLIYGNYNITVNQGVCDYSFTDQLIENPSNFEVDIQPESSVICRNPGETYTVEAVFIQGDNTGKTFRWLLNGSPFAGDDGLQTIEITQTGDYTVEVTDANGCMTSVTENIEVNNNPAAIINQDGNACEGQITFLASASPSTDTYSFRWTRPDGTTTTGPSYLVSDPSESGTYSLTAISTSTGCENQISTDVTVFEPLDVFAVPTNVQCNDGSEVTFEASANKTNVTYRWFGTNGNPIPDTNSPTFTTFEEGGVISVEVTDENNCSVRENLLIDRKPVGFSDLQDFAEICSQIGAENPELSTTTLISDLDNEFIIYQWTYNGVPVGANSPEYTTEIGQTGGLYEVSMENAFGCVVNDSIFVEDKCTPTFGAPNAIRPNSGIDDNQRFKIFPRFISANDFELVIYNRWGELIYYTNDIDFEWDATHNGNDVPVGSYVYVATFKSEFEDGEYYKQRGGVTVLR